MLNITRTVVLCALCTLAVLTIKCAREGPGDERVLRIGGLAGRPAALNPIITNQTVSVVLIDLIFNGLVRINPQALPEPALAESWQASADGLNYTFNLRKGVRFHDGVEFTADDCVFTYQAVLDPANDSPWLDSYGIIKECRAEGRYTFVITLKRPRASFINLLWLNIVPKHLLSGLKGLQLRQTEFNRHPIGTGPFRFKEWNDTPLNPLLIEGTSKSNSQANFPLTRGGRGCVILEANPDYYEGRPHLDKIIAIGYDTFPQYFSAFIKGQSDLAIFLSQEQYQAVSRDRNFRTYQIPSVHTYALDYNLEHPLFRDKKVRQALAHAIDVKALISKVEGGFGIPSTGPFLPGAWNHDPEIAPLEYNPALALKLLKDERWEFSTSVIPAKAGIQDNQRNIDSCLRRNDTLVNGDGREFRFTLLVDTGERNTEIIAKIIYQELYKIGIRIEIQPFDYIKEKENKRAGLPAAAIAEAGAFLTTFHLPNELEPPWHSKEQAESGKLYKYLNPELDRLFEQANLAADLGQRKELYHRIQRLIYDEQPATFLYFHANLGAVNNRFTNTDELFSPLMPFYTIKDWEIHHKGHEEHKEED